MPTAYARRIPAKCRELGSGDDLYTAGGFPTTRHANCARAYLGQRHRGSERPRHGSDVSHTRPRESPPDAHSGSLAQRNSTWGPSRAYMRR
ncbi:hypothetical protein EVG20_g8703 [Dentipellis fragilis]|uniref:Uncharacterized protein n=1 Tax=Dentipellis fragilis TaxID=205917 RepID=A0A4Y9Y6F3_9AGAM|nr:hypothetical protein EVG20_g8703 [Dentipellis fragilis]